MIQLYDLKPCSDYPDAVQAEGKITTQDFFLQQFEKILLKISFQVYSIGDPIVLICRRNDSMLIVNSDGSFNISQVPTEEILLGIIHDIRIQLETNQKELR